MTALQKQIVIIGGGAGGLELATRLGNNIGRTKQAKIILVDCNHSHVWKPLLHEVATGSLNEDLDAISYVAHAQNHSFKFLLGRMSNIDRKKKHILLDEIYDDNGNLLFPSRTISYDILVISLGSISNDFGIPSVKDHCIFLDSAVQAKRFHNKMLNMFLKKSNQSNLTEEGINIAIVGGGATGVELSAELYNAVKQLHSYGIDTLNQKLLRVTLIEAGNRILPALPPEFAAMAHRELIKIGVRILTNTIISNTDDKGLYEKSGKYISADLMVWAAGIKVPDFMKNIGGLDTNGINQLIVNSTLQTTRDEDIFAMGDCASCPIIGGGIVPPRAQAAHQMASLVYSNIIAQLHGSKNLKSYIYKDYGSLISLSRFNTIGIIMGIGKLIRKSLIINGSIARIIYISLYRIHQISLHGYLKTGLIILVDRINRILRPHIRLY